MMHAIYLIAYLNHKIVQDVTMFVNDQSQNEHNNRNKSSYVCSKVNVCTFNLIRLFFIGLFFSSFWVDGDKHLSLFWLAILLIYLI